MERAWHGRTLATLAATGSRKAQAGFEPLVTGFIRVPYNDIEAVRSIAAHQNSVVAVLSEVVQGEGGIVEARADYLRALRELCDQQDWMLMIDEVQSGIGRTGKWFAHQRSGIVPDVMPLAKGLGSGFPIGACLARGVAAQVYKSGQLLLAEKEEDGVFPIVKVEGDENSKKKIFFECLERAERNSACEAVRREIALAKSIVYAEKELLADEAALPDGKVSDDWILRWRQCAENVGSEELHSLWGKVLAGETKSPGSFSLRTLDFVKNLSSDEALLIEKIAPFVIRNKILLPGVRSGTGHLGAHNGLEKYGVELKDLLSQAGATN